MNKYEFKSAYDKITLSDDFKREAREKLRAMAGGDRSALPLSDGDGGRAVAIKAPERGKSPAKAVIGIVSAAAVLAACVLGGRYLLKRDPGIIGPNDVSERQWLDYGTALEISRSNSEKPYTKEFAEELSDEARENGYSFENITAYPCGNDYFAVKKYSVDYASSDLCYYEIYLISGDEPKLLADYSGLGHKTLIGDGEYLYYTDSGYLNRISRSGGVEDITEFKENDASGEPMELCLTYIGDDVTGASASGSGDILTVYNICYTNSEDEIFTYDYTVNAVTLEVNGRRVIREMNEGMPAPFVATDIENPYENMFYQPFEFYGSYEYITDNFTEDIPPRELDIYCGGFDIVNAPSDNIMGYPTLYSFVRYFDLFDKYEEEGDYASFVLSDDMAEATAFFANRYALVVGDKIYSPNWVYLHSVEDWREAGIIDNGLAEAAEKYREFPFTDEARQAFEAKLEEALGYHVSLEYRSAEETAETVTDDVPDEPAELTYDDLATVDENGNFVWSGHTGSADITLQPLEAAPAPERDESAYNTFGDPVSAATEAIDRSKFHGLTIVGQVEGATEYVYPLEDTFGVDMGMTDQFKPRVLPDYTLDAATSVYNDDIVSLHYTDGNGGEFYVNITAREREGKLERYVADDSGNIYVGLSTDKLPTYVLSEKDFADHNFTSSYSAFSFMYIGGRRVDGENYFYAYRKSGDMPEDFTLCLSAKGCSLDDFMDLIAAVVQYRAWGFGDFNGYKITDPPMQYIFKSIETEHGTLVLNQGKYLGTGAGYSYEVNSAIPKNEMGTFYTEADMTEFTGNSALFELPLGFEPTETSVDYMANYADFHDGYNIQLFHEGRPLLGESESDEDFIEAHKYFYDGYCYAYDKLPYFEDKTPMVQVYDADFTDGNAAVNIQAYKGDFGQRYMGFGFQFLPAEPSNLCEDYYNDYVYAQGNGEKSLTRIFAAEYSEHMDETLRDHYYGGFLKNGVYYVVTAENLDAQAFADILAALYQG